jgi:hypothetical protein
MARLALILAVSLVRVPLRHCVATRGAKGSGNFSGGCGPETLCVDDSQATEGAGPSDPVNLGVGNCYQDVEGAIDVSEATSCSAQSSLG